ncbi:LCP family protein [Candidatus Dojkabacteria bacterium]|uniref:LCP family protein n=1 Tax=Candidatus Dojkabacteria bacterium TaxID=2099670 RepID=A0A955I8A8_9BACT|nr:LCP family protein [Candidatus Dojkabacteria bacterium]
MYKVEINQVKKSTPKKRLRKRVKFILYPILFLMMFGTFFAIDYLFFSGADLFSRNSIIRVISTGTQFVDKFVDLELKNDNKVTSVLIAGVDTRDIIFEDGEFKSTKPKGQAGTRNIDTIIQVVYDHETEKLTMISIPRDLGVDFRGECLKFSGSIHWIYDKTENANCPGRGIEELKDTVTSVTGIPIQYHIFITLDSFVEAIETVGETNPETGEVGIYVDNPSDVWDVYPFNDYGWENVYFKKGKIFLSSEDALKYVRVRQLTSDFGRARRQQIVIEAVLNRALTSETLLDPNKLTDLYKIYQEKTLVSELTVKEILAGTKLIEKFDLEKVINVVLDPEIGGSEKYLNKQPHNRPGGPYYMVPTHWKDCPGNEFCRIQELLKSIIENPVVYEENAEVFAYGTAYSQGKLYFDYPEFAEFSTTEPPLRITNSKYLVSLSKEFKDQNSIIILDFSEGELPSTRQYLSQNLSTNIIDGESYKKYRLNKEDFAILLPSPK